MSELASRPERASRRRSSNFRQKLTNKRTEFHEFRKLGRLSEIPVGAESFHVLAVALGIRGRHDQDKRILAARAGAQPAQYVASFIAGHVDVKEDQVRTGRSWIGIRLLEKPDGLLAVVGHVNMRVDPGRGERLPDQVDIGFAILCNQNPPLATPRLIRLRE